MNALSTPGRGQRMLSLAGFAPAFPDSSTGGNRPKPYALHYAEEWASVRSVTVGDRTFGEIPGSEEEVRTIVTDFNKSGKQSVAFLRSDATKENLKENASHCRFLHIATHSYVDEENPKLSGLLFSQSTSSAEDAVLYPGETYNLNLKADLLVLSSCESGMGKLVKGEGLMAITRGFFFAGARNIVFSLWKVYDRHTNQLMTEFYRNVLKGDSFTSSLREAKLAMIKNETSAFPAKWAGFVLMGRQPEGDNKNFTQSSQ